MYLVGCRWLTLVELVGRNKEQSDKTIAFIVKAQLLTTALVVSLVANLQFLLPKELSSFKESELERELERGREKKRFSKYINSSFDKPLLSHTCLRNHFTSVGKHDANSNIQQFPDSLVIRRICDFAPGKVVLLTNCALTGRPVRHQLPIGAQL